MYLHESNRAANDLARSVIVVLIVETMNALWMVHQSELDVFGQRHFHKAINRVIHRGNFVTPGTANEHRRNLALQSSIKAILQDYQPIALSTSWPKKIRSGSAQKTTDWCAFATGRLKPSQLKTGC